MSQNSMIGSVDPRSNQKFYKALLCQSWIRCNMKVLTSLILDPEQEKRVRVGLKFYKHSIVRPLCCRNLLKIILLKIKTSYKNEDQN